MVNVTNCASTGFVPTLSLIKGTYKNGILHASTKSAPERVLSEKTCECLRSMMKKCVSEGTGQKAHLYGVSSGGKTATAQTGQLDENGREVLHTWFCGIYPCDSPKYSIIIFCDGNGRNKYLPAEIFAIVNKHLINCGY
jgi:cell division protein FtsI/penicillin-binding protein 2